MSHLVKNVQLRSFSGPYFLVFNPFTGKYKQEKGPYLDTFYEVLVQLKKYLNRLMSKGMSNIYLKVTNEKN